MFAQTLVRTHCTANPCRGEPPARVSSPSWVTNTEQDWEKRKITRTRFLAGSGLWKAQREGLSTAKPAAARYPPLPTHPRSQGRCSRGLPEERGSNPGLDPPRGPQPAPRPPRPFPPAPIKGDIFDSSKLPVITPRRRREAPHRGARAHNYCNCTSISGERSHV